MRRSEKGCKDEDWRERLGELQTGNETMGMELGFGDGSCRGLQDRSRDAHGTHILNEMVTVRLVATFLLDVYNFTGNKSDLDFQGGLWISIRG